MVRRAITGFILLLGLSGCAYDGGFTDDYIAGYGYQPRYGFGWPAPNYGYAASYRSPSYRYGNPFYGRASYYDPFYCPPFLAVGNGFGRTYGFYGRGYGRGGYGYVDPDGRVKRERKQQKKALKKERKVQRKVLKQERKVQKRQFKQERKSSPSNSANFKRNKTNAPGKSPNGMPNLSERSRHYC